MKIENVEHQLTIELEHPDDNFDDEELEQIGQEIYDVLTAHSITSGSVKVVINEDN